jgi:glutamate dehydrogenase/leucine dehydrogenase
LGALVESGGAGMVGDEARGFAFVEGAEFFAVDVGQGKTIIGKGGMSNSSANNSRTRAESRPSRIHTFII